jgi:hypothetical protein
MESVIAKSASVWQQKFGEAKMTKDELKLAFQKAFQMGQDYWYHANHEFESYNKKSDAIKEKFNEMVKETIEEALAQPEQEPVGKFAKFTDGIWREVTDGSAGVSLYTTPPQRKPCTTCEALARSVMMDQTGRDA